MQATGSKPKRKQRRTTRAQICKTATSSGSNTTARASLAASLPDSAGFRPSTSTVESVVLLQDRPSQQPSSYRINFESNPLCKRPIPSDKLLPITSSPVKASYSCRIGLASNLAATTSTVWTEAGFQLANLDDFDSPQQASAISTRLYLAAIHVSSTVKASYSCRIVQAAT